jgi:hypothetical protein
MFTIYFLFLLVALLSHYFQTLRYLFQRSFIVFGLNCKGSHLYDESAGSTRVCPFTLFCVLFSSFLSLRFTLKNPLFRLLVSYLFAYMLAFSAVYYTSWMNFHSGSVCFLRCFTTISGHPILIRSFFLELHVGFIFFCVGFPRVFTWLLVLASSYGLSLLFILLLTYSSFFSLLFLYFVFQVVFEFLVSSLLTVL